MVLGHGIDIVQNKRIADMLDEHGERFITRCFTDRERDYAESSPDRRVERYAARFAVKEAVFKALGTGWRSGLSWTDMEVCRDPLGRPVLQLSGGCAEEARKRSISQWSISLSHTSDCSVGSAIATGSCQGSN